MSSPIPSPKSANEHLATIKQLRSLSHVLDRAVTIPGTSISIGLDSVLGLLPVAGDYMGLFLSAYIVLQAGTIGLPKETLLRMVLNIIFDAVIGTVPVLGDLFDFTFKANTKNVALLESHIASPQPHRKADKWFIYLLLAGLLLIVTAITFISVYILSKVWQLITGG